MNYFENSLKKLKSDFILSNTQILDIANKFSKSMKAGLDGKKSSLKMLPSFVGIPTGEEKGIYASIDFGGTNVRMFTVELLGHGKTTIIKQISVPLKDQKKGYDYTSISTTGTDLFNFIADNLGSILIPTLKYPLGHTFSFPCHQLDVNKAKLIKWTKEIKTSYVEGQEISEMLKSALKEKKLHNIFPKAIINDTIGTFLTSAYNNPLTSIGSICGTGHNSCYFEDNSDGNRKNNMIINIESGNFNEIPFTNYDLLLDIESDKPGDQHLEKMVGGRYLGELTRIIISEYIKNKLIFAKGNSEMFMSPNIIKSEDLSCFMVNKGDSIKDWLNSKCNIFNVLPQDIMALNTIASTVILRSIQLIAATFIGILLHIDQNLEKDHIIAIDGSLYENIPGYAEKLDITLKNISKNRFSIDMVKNGSGVGAAIAAALV